MINFSLKEAERTVAKWKGEKPDDAGFNDSPKLEAETGVTNSKNTDEKSSWECPELLVNLDTAVKITDLRDKTKNTEKSDDKNANKTNDELKAKITEKSSSSPVKKQADSVDKELNDVLEECKSKYGAVISLPPKPTLKREHKPSLDDMNNQILAKKTEAKKSKLSFGFGQKPPPEKSSLVFSFEKKSEFKVPTTPDKDLFSFGQKPTKLGPKTPEPKKPTLSFGFGQKKEETSLKFSFETKNKTDSQEKESVKMPDLTSFLKPMDQPITDDEKCKIVEISDSSSEDSDDSFSDDEEPILVTINNDQTEKNVEKKKTKSLSERAHFKSGKGIKFDFSSDKKLKKSKKSKKKVPPEVITKIDNLQKILRTYPANFDSLPKAANDIDEKLDFVEFSISKLLGDFEDYTKSDTPRLNQARFGDLKSTDKCCLVRIGDVELGLGTRDYF